MHSTSYFIDVFCTPSPHPNCFSLGRKRRTFYNVICTTISSFVDRQLRITSNCGTKVLQSMEQQQQPSLAQVDAPWSPSVAKVMCQLNSCNCSWTVINSWTRQTGETTINQREVPQYTRDVIDVTEIPSKKYQVSTCIQTYFFSLLASEICKASTCTLNMDSSTTDHRLSIPYPIILLTSYSTKRHQVHLKMHKVYWIRSNIRCSDFSVTHRPVYFTEMSARCITLCGEKVLTKNNNLYISTLFQFVVIVVL